MRLKLQIKKKNFILKNNGNIVYIFKYFDIKEFGASKNKYAIILVDDTKHEFITPKAKKIYKKIYKKTLRLLDSPPIAQIINTNIVDGILYNEQEHESLLPMAELINNY